MNQLISLAGRVKIEWGVKPLNRNQNAFDSQESYRHVGLEPHPQGFGVCPLTGQRILIPGLDGYRVAGGWVGTCRQCQRLSQDFSELGICLSCERFNRTSKQNKR